MKTAYCQGFTLVEIMIVVAIIGILASIAIPNFIKDRALAQARNCCSNLQLIETAAENWLAENRTGDISSTDWVEKLVGPLNYIKHEPKCPRGGTYSVSVNQETGVINVSCSIGGHALDRYKTD